jgi:hypothetical protein
MHIHAPQTNEKIYYRYIRIFDDDDDTDVKLEIMVDFKIQIGKDRMGYNTGWHTNS